MKKHPCTRRCCVANAACSHCFATGSPDADCSKSCSWHHHRGDRSLAGPIDRSCRTMPVGAPGTYVHRCLFSRYLPPRPGASLRRRVSTSEIRRYRDRSAIARAAARASLAEVFSWRSHKSKRAAERPLEGVESGLAGVVVERGRPVAGGFQLFRPGKFTEQLARRLHVGEMGGFRRREQTEISLPMFVVNNSLPPSRPAGQVNAFVAGGIVP